MRFIDAVNERASVIEYWRKTGSEPFAHPDYLTGIGGGGAKSGVLVDGSDDEVVILPIICRDLAALHPELSGTDCISPYGYGGPYGGGSHVSELFLSRVYEWLCEERFASAFLRLDLQALPQCDVSQTLTVSEVSKNIVIDLSVDVEKMWQSYESKVRKNVRRALSSGCSVVRVNAVDNLDEFLHVYHQTMARRGASEFYLFERDDLMRLVASSYDIAAMYFVLNAHGDVISVELVLQSTDAVYSFLGGTLEEYFPLRPNDLLKHTIAEAASAAGKSRFVLGGGYARDDGIFRYKKSFAPQGVYPFSVARVVGDVDLYRAALRARGYRDEVRLNASFFPEYRDENA